MSNLEKIAGEVTPTTNNSSEALSPQQMAFSHFYKETLPNYIVDLSAGLLFYNPLMAGIVEPFVGGMTGAQIFNSRIAASATQGVTMRPTGALRNRRAKYFGITPESPWYMKARRDIGALLAYQIPAYATSLYLSGADLIEKGPKAMLGAIALTALTNNGTKWSFGSWMDYWRGLWGKKKAFK